MSTWTRGGLNPETAVSLLGEESYHQVVRVLADSFMEYPVMRFVLGFGPDYSRQLPIMVGLFVSARLMRGEPVLGVQHVSGDLAGVALVTLPGERPSPESFLRRKDEVWLELGEDARHRYEAYAACARSNAVMGEHHHLNMIGVVRNLHGHGYARVLLEAVHRLADSDPRSTGVSLTTEHEANLSLYEHFGYRIEGHSRLSDTLEIWSLFRPRFA